MWIALLVMAAATSVEPVRIGLTLLMLNRPRPALQLMAFLCGGFVMGTTGGLVVLFLLPPTLAESSGLTLPRAQIAIGALALLTAAVLAVRIVTDRPSAMRADRADSVPARFSARAQRLLKGRSLWVAGTAGLSIALPSVDYLAALAIIVASGDATSTKIAALLTFNVLAFALVEIPLLAYLLAPGATRGFMATLHKWGRTRRPGQVAALLATVGGVLCTAGVLGL
ncbi:GAP family protein [[Mycobacterium] holstebronense]|uniref:GAP family protein n=1 Tax=[Mycobacterium] holstebronense TaxID=3064288 RepID=A0ABN9NRQ0_9MYCO|nr:GAP family protein [Mycolicibacter sp. MU0102]CAJ1510845.1 GAP family protein [Mycolicibacter sp. MU0102]